MDKELHDKAIEYLTGLYRCAENHTLPWNDFNATKQQYYGVCDCLVILGIVTNQEIKEIEEEI